MSRTHFIIVDQQNSCHEHALVALIVLFNLRRRHVPASYRLTDGCGDIDPCCGCFLQHFARLAQKALALPRGQLLGGNHYDRYFAPLLACGKGVQELEPG